MADYTSPSASMEAGYVNVQGSIGGINFQDISTKEIILGESLLTPGLQTAITFQSYIYANHDLSRLKKASINMTLTSGITRNTMTIDQVVYRVDNRNFNPISVGQTQEFTAHACDQSLLDDAKKLISKSWKCEMPSKIVQHILKDCLNVQDSQVDMAGPGRDYVAENIHPFKVISEQCNVAVYGDNDPSFLHYMTFENGGKHYFRALGSMIKEPSRTYIYSETGVLSGQYDYNKNTGSAISFSFPCDFDLLSDYLNGVDEGGVNFNSLTTFDPKNMSFNLIGQAAGDCGIGGGNMKQSMTNKGSAGEMGSCKTDVETHLHKRQARMALLEKDKIRLRIIVPWDGTLHVGQTIKFNWFKNDPQERIYGSGSYLIVSMLHNIQFGGFSTTTLDCIDMNSLKQVIGG